MSYDPDPAKRRKKKAKRKARRYDPDPARRLRIRRGGMRFRTRAWPFLAGIGMARVFEKVCDLVGLTGLASAIAKPIGAYVGGKWKGLGSEIVYELVDERTDDVFGLLGVKAPALGPQIQAGGGV
ncbi:MAG: hypothetical protein QXU09_03460 [Thermoproteota archaeon]